MHGHALNKPTRVIQDTQGQKERSGIKSAGHYVGVNFLFETGSQAKQWDCTCIEPRDGNGSGMSRDPGWVW